MLRRKKIVPAVTRVLDSPMSMMISPTALATPATNGRVLIVHGNFEHISDSEAFNLLKDRLDKFEF